MNVKRKVGHCEKVEKTVGELLAIPGKMGIGKEYEFIYHEGHKDHEEE